MNTVRMLLLGLLVLPFARAVPIDIFNPSGEINGGSSPLAVNDASVPGWDGTAANCQVIRNNTDYGNGAWRISFEDSSQFFQMTSHEIATGEAYSLRFDAAVFSGGPAEGSFTPDLTLVGAGVRNGDFNDDTSAVSSRTFSETPFWTNVGTGTQAAEATKTDNGFDGSRNAVVSGGTAKLFGVDTGHTLAAGEAFRVSYVWRDAASWNDAADTISVSLFTTSDDSITGAATILQTIDSQASGVDSAYQSETSVFSTIPAAAAGKRLFVSFGAPAVASGRFARLDNLTVESGTVSGARTLTADLYVDDVGSRQVVASRTYDFKSPVTGSWQHYHLAVPGGSLDAHAGKTLGIQFRGNVSASSNFQSVDNVRLDFWEDSPPDGAFADDWNGTPDQPWPGPGYWANRMQDWTVAGSRVECIDASLDRRTLHRPGTSIRGNGGAFSLSVSTGLNTGTNSAGSRSGFLIGGAPNVDWRGALLVHDGLGRDFGLFAGITGDGDLVIEDYSTGAVTPLAVTSNTAGFGQGTRLELDTVYNGAEGTYTLTMEGFNAADTSLGVVQAEVPSDRVLGAFGLLCHRGGGSSTYWYDDFSGSGPALEPEEERHLAILGAIHTLSKGTMKLTAQLSALDVAGAGPVALDLRDGGSWVPAASVAIDNTDNLSSYTATFRVDGWDDTKDTDYRLRTTIGGKEYVWTGTIPKDPVDKAEIVVASVTCQRITDTSLQTDGFDWSPVEVWQPHVLLYEHIAKHQPDLLLAHGDQIYEGQPTSEDSNAGALTRQLDYLYKWNLWVLQARELTRRIPTVAIPDDHDVYHGNLWGEGGIATTNQNTGGYEEPADWVRMVERTQTSNLPDPDPYNPVQPAPPVAQGIRVYFTGMTYGRLGFAILEDRKFKTGPTNPPADPGEQFLLGDRQKDFLREWNKDWAGQDLKLVVSQSPFANLHTHSGSGYNYFLNDKDTHGWPVHRRNEAWELLRVSRMFQLAGDQHLASLSHNGVDAPRDAGLSFTVPAVANFLPRAFDPVHNSSGTTPVVSPYLGDYYFDGNGMLPDGVTPNRSATDPHHFAILGAANPLQYYQQDNGISPVNLHSRGAGYGITRIDKKTRRFTFECWPIHPDPEFPGTGGQYADWPQTFRQTDNDGRTPSGYLPVVDTQWRKNAVVRVFDEADGALVHAMRVRGNLYRPPVYDNGTTYRVEIAYEDEVVSETRNGQAALPPGAPAIHSFLALPPSIAAGSPATLRWDVVAPTSLSIDHGVGDVMEFTVDGIGYLEVSPATDTTYTLTLDGGPTASTTVRVFSSKQQWLDLHFSPAEQLDPLISGDDADADVDGVSNADEYRFQTDPRDPSSKPLLQGRVIDDGGQHFVRFETSWPLDSADCTLVVESSDGLESWQTLPSNSYREISRIDTPAEGTTRVTLQIDQPVPEPGVGRRFYRGSWR